MARNRARVDGKPRLFFRSRFPSAAGLIDWLSDGQKETPTVSSDGRSISRRVGYVMLEHHGALNPNTFL